MIVYKHGDMFGDNAQALANPVNCVGVMGAGVAAQFKKRWPNYFQDYVTICEAREISPGIPVFHMMPGQQGRYIISFPTKDHWKNSSNLVSIHRGLTMMATKMRADGINSVAMPALGCGNGGLDWADVKALLDAFGQSNPDLDIRVYEPGFDERPLRLPR